jgi:hypothetical protein
MCAKPLYMSFTQLSRTSFPVTFQSTLSVLSLRLSGGTLCFALGFKGAGDGAAAGAGDAVPLEVFGVDVPAPAFLTLRPPLYYQLVCLAGDCRVFVLAQLVHCNSNAGRT